MSELVTVDAHELRLLMDAMERRARSVSRLMPAIADSLVAAVSDVYDAEGPGWEPLKAATLKNRRGSTAKILQDTGVMAGSTSAGHGMSFAEARAGAAYAIFHVNGNDHLPRRDPFDLGPFERQVLDETEELLLSALTTL